MDVWYLLLGINLFGFFLCWADKQKAKRKQWRISERALFGVTLAGGGFGMWAGMYLFHHKTKHWYFVVGVPMITLLEYGALAWWFFK